MKNLKRSKNIQISLKYTLERVVALILFLLCLPVFLVIALLIKKDGGPVLFSQQRLGLEGHTFKILKFRSMVVGADRFLNNKGESTVNRITPIGHFLRKTSLDELPQLVNIVKGDMAIIGPRPTLVEHFQYYTDTQKKRFQMKPGVTGLAQVNGRNTLKWSRRLAYDFEYVDKYSLWLDFKIAFKTVKVVLTGDGMVMDRNASQVNDLNDQGGTESENK